MTEDETLSLVPVLTPALTAGLAGVVAAGILVASDYPVCAGWVVLTLFIEGWRFWRDYRRFPKAIFWQGMRWWLVDAQGEIDGPYRLDLRTRVTAGWIALRLRHLHRGRRACWMTPASTGPKGWSLLHWQIRAQAARLRVADP